MAGNNLATVNWKKSLYNWDSIGLLSRVEILISMLHFTN